MSDHSVPPKQPGFTAAENRQAQRLGVVLAITAAFVTLELSGAVLARSDVLLADGAHLLLDVLALALSIAAMRLAVRAPSERFTFGLRRVEPMAALFNGFLVVVVACAIIAEAVDDFHSTSSPRPTIMLIVAAAAVVVHGISAWLIHDAIGHVGQPHGHEHGGAHVHEHEHEHGDAHEHGKERPHAHGHTLNLRAVWLHLMGDMLGAITALIAAIVIRFGGSPRVDAAGSVVVALILLAGAIRLVRDATLVLLDAAPIHLPAQAVQKVVLAEPGVVGVSQLRVWSLGAGHDAVMLRVRVGDAAGNVGLASRLRERLHHDLGVELCTVEVEQ